MSASQRLYTPELLGLAVELASWPLLGSPARHGEARSATCGSSIALDILADDAGSIDRVGMQVRACAVGQASAAIFARHAVGRDIDGIGSALAELEDWLASDGTPPDWPDIALIDAARAFPARHGAILLPWRAALVALSSPDASS